jgi:predicted dehydrogenase
MLFRGESRSCCRIALPDLEVSRGEEPCKERGEKLMKIAVIGLGYWGPNLVRNFLETEGIEGVVCCDLREQRLDRIRRQFPLVEVATNCVALYDRPDIDAVALATPVSTHFQMGMRALEAGKHVLLEKPLTLCTAEAERMVEFAEREGLSLMVDHTFVYTGAVRKIKEFMTQGDLGDPMYFDSVRVNLGLFQRDTNVIWDLAAHDVSIMNYLLDVEPLTVSAVGSRHVNGMEDIAYIAVLFPNNLIAHFHVNWISPVKVRKILLGGTKKMVVYDDMEASDKVKVYNKGVEVNGNESLYKVLVQYRMGDMFAPSIDQTEALSLMVKEFVDSVKMRRRPLTDGTAGANVVRILEAAEKSLRSGGGMVRLREESPSKDQIRLAVGSYAH